MALPPYEYGASYDRYKDRNGGSSGKDYLKAAADKHYIFREIAQLNSFLIERRRLPTLSNEMEMRLGFAHQ
jgi:tryptophan 2,3-dioxygenase